MSIIDRIKNAAFDLIVNMVTGPSVAGILAAPMGCASTCPGALRRGHDAPESLDGPPQDLYVGESGCLPMNPMMGRQFAFIDALKKKCNFTSGRIELVNYYPRTQGLCAVRCYEGEVTYALFKSEDLDCSLLKPR